MPMESMAAVAVSVPWSSRFRDWVSDMERRSVLISVRRALPTESHSIRARMRLVSGLRWMMVSRMYSRSVIIVVSEVFASIDSGYIFGLHEMIRRTVGMMMSVRMCWK